MLARRRFASIYGIRCACPSFDKETDRERGEGAGKGGARNETADALGAKSSVAKGERLGSSQRGADKGGVGSRALGGLGGARHGPRLAGDCVPGISVEVCQNDSIQRYKKGLQMSSILRHCKVHREHVLPCFEGSRPPCAGDGGKRHASRGAADEKRKGVSEGQERTRKNKEEKGAGEQGEDGVLGDAGVEEGNGGRVEPGGERMGNGEEAGERVGVGGRGGNEKSDGGMLGGRQRGATKSPSRSPEQRGGTETECVNVREEDGEDAAQEESVRKGMQVKDVVCDLAPRAHARVFASIHA